MSFKVMDIKHAEVLARQQVLALWPDLAGVEPSIAPRTHHRPAPAALTALGVGQAGEAPEGEEYTFTFKGSVRTPEGYTLPQVARVTVNMLRGVVKVSGSR